LPGKGGLAACRSVQQISHPQIVQEEKLLAGHRWVRYRTVNRGLDAQYPGGLYAQGRPHLFMNHQSLIIPARRTVYKVVVACVLLSMSAGTFAGDLDFLLNSVWSKLTAEDIGLAESAALDLLKDGKVGERRDWSNPHSTAKGSLRIVKVFRSEEGFSCKTLRAENTAGGLHGGAAYPVCEVKPGDWKVYSSATTASP
jgi:hypothetical protein